MPAADDADLAQVRAQILRDYLDDDRYLEAVEQMHRVEEVLGRELTDWEQHAVMFFLGHAVGRFEERDFVVDPAERPN